MISATQYRRVVAESRKRLRALPWLVALTAALLTFAIAIPARAESPRAEAAAKQALAKAEDLYLAMTFVQGLAVLRTAERGCGDDRCTGPTRAALLRDIGTFLFRQGDTTGANAAFVSAIKLDASIVLNPSYDAKDLRARWDAAKDSIATSFQPGEGDFVHTPPREQKETTPLPIYVEYRGSEGLANVIVKYKNDTMGSWKRAKLTRVGAGWGGYIPCVDVVRGLVRYYIQGVDATELPILSSGSPRQAFTVPIHESLRGEAPALPGLRAPETCGDEELQVLRLEVGERCQEDNQCASGTCAAGRCAKATEVEVTSGEYARFWFGVAGSVDIAALPANTDVCKQSGGLPLAGAYFCTNPDGSDFPVGAQNDALVPGHSGKTDGGFATGDIRVLATLDYAATANVLVGARLGFVAESYPGHAASDAGRGASAAFHGELRGTYLFGDDPLTRPGLVPTAYLGAGYGRFDAGTRVTVTQQNIVGEKAVQAWDVSGPFFASVGVGLRDALSARVGFLVGIKGTLAFGAGGALFNVAPELGLQYGF